MRTKTNNIIEEAESRIREEQWKRSVNRHGPDYRPDEDCWEPAGWYPCGENAFELKRKNGERIATITFEPEIQPNVQKRIASFMSYAPALFRVLKTYVF